MFNCLVIVALLTVLTVVLQYGVDSGLTSTRLLDMPYTTVVKGIAILLILVSHTASTMGTVAFTPCGGIGVALFLICSGYGLMESWKKNGLKFYWRKKITRVFIPYVLVYFCISIAYGRNVEEMITVLLRGGYWYIAYLTKWYLAFWMTMLIAPRYRLAIMSLVAICFFFTLSGIEAEQSLSFIAGICLSDYKDSLKRVAPKALIEFSLMAIALGIGALAVKQLPAIKDNPGVILNLTQMTIKFATASGILFITGYLHRILNSRFLYFFGIVSYECYLLQMPFYSHLHGSLSLAMLFIILLTLASFLYNKFNSWLTIIINKYICA